MNKRKSTHILAVLLLVLLAGALSGCGKSKEEKYRTYVQALTDAAYFGTFDAYMEATGTNCSDAEALYNASVRRLAESLGEYFELDIDADATLSGRMQDIARSIYSKARIEFSDIRTENGEYYIDVTITPMDFLNSMEDKLTAYDEEYRRRIEAGEFNDTDKESYAKAFAEGLLDLLSAGTAEMTYLEPVTLTLQIHEGSGSYFISDADFRKIDRLIIATEER